MEHAVWLVREHLGISKHGQQFHLKTISRKNGEILDNVRGETAESLELEPNMPAKPDRIPKSVIVSGRF